MEKLISKKASNLKEAFMMLYDWRKRPKEITPYHLIFNRLRAGDTKSVAEIKKTNYYEYSAFTLWQNSMRGDDIFKIYLDL
jgi:hypothetical protein